MLIIAVCINNIIYFILHSIKVNLNVGSQIHFFQLWLIIELK